MTFLLSQVRVLPPLRSYISSRYRVPMFCRGRQSTGQASRFYQVQQSTSFTSPLMVVPNCLNRAGLPSAAPHFDCWASQTGSATDANRKLRHQECGRTSCSIAGSSRSLRRSFRPVGPLPFPLRCCPALVSSVLLFPCFSPFQVPPNPAVKRDALTRAPYLYVIRLHVRRISTLSAVSIAS